MLDFKLIELTQPLYPNCPTWDQTCGFCIEVKKDYDKLFRVQALKMHAGVGTHMDTPSHLIEGGFSIDGISMDKLIIPICVINVSDKANADYEISVEEIELYEKSFGKIPPNCLVIGYTGWSNYWLEPQKYRNADDQGQMHFPAFSGRAAEILVEREIAGIAIDTLSPDCLDPAFAVHRHILGAGMYIIENIGDCSKIPPKGAYAAVLPLLIPGATESPTRIVGLIPK